MCPHDAGHGGLLQRIAGNTTGHTHTYLSRLAWMLVRKAGLVESILIGVEKAVEVCRTIEFLYHVLAITGLRYNTRRAQYWNRQYSTIHGTL